MITKKLKLFLFVIVLPALLLVAVSYLQKGNGSKTVKEASGQRTSAGK